jgi:hypothetical protein
MPRRQVSLAVRHHMQVRVSREACCAQDDQLGPLEKTYSLAPDATLQELIEKIVESSFLQYSSSHTSMVGEVDAMGVVRVFSPHYAANQASEYLVSPNEQVSSLIPDGGLSFRFVFA